MSKMRIRNFKESKNILEKSEILIKEPLNYKGEFNKLFKNNNAICLEIGMGKGQFNSQIALDNPNINYIGIEKYDTIVAKALQKIEDLQLPNLRVIRIDAIRLNEIFDKEIDTIYLNHSDPWPKDRHEKRRLTSSNFLNIYDQVFKGKKEIVLKTDNVDFFNYSLESLKKYGYKILEYTYDLESTDIKSYLTEYSEKFIEKGFKINYLKALKK